MWFADSKYGLVSYRTDGYTYHYPNGPNSELALNMSLSDDQLWVAPGGYAKYLADGLYQFKEEQWNNVKANTSTIQMDTIRDFMNVLVDPNNSKIVYAATWGQGVLELYDGVPVKTYNNPSNCSLSSFLLHPNLNHKYLQGCNLAALILIMNNLKGYYMS